MSQLDEAWSDAAARAITRGSEPWLVARPERRQLAAVCGDVLWQHYRAPLATLPVALPSDCSESPPGRAAAPQPAGAADPSRKGTGSGL